MTSRERQKLLYFSTGSSVLPALDNRVGNNGEEDTLFSVGWIVAKVFFSY